MSEASQACADTDDLIMGKLVLLDTAWEIWRSGDIRKARALIEEKLDISRQIGSTYATSVMLSSLVCFCAYEGDYQAAQVYAEENVALGSRFSPINEGDALGDLGAVEFYQGHLAAARPNFENFLKISRAEDYPIGIVRSLIYISAIHVFEGRIHPGMGLLEEATTLFKKLPESLNWFYDDYYLLLSMIIREQGDYSGARALICDYLRRIWKNGDVPKVPQYLEALAGTSLGLQEFQRGAILLGSAQHQREVAGVPLHPVFRTDYEKTLLGLKAALSEAEFQQAWADGAAFSAAESVDYALT